MTYTPDTPLEALAGIGPKKAQAFQKLGVATLRDLAGLYPRRYDCLLYTSDAADD